MTKIYCDVCGKDVSKRDIGTYLWNRDMFYDLNDHPIADICPDCWLTLRCCLIMMRETGWKPDFHEKLESGSIWDRDIAADILSEFKDKTGLKLD